MKRDCLDETSFKESTRITILLATMPLIDGTPGGHTAIAWHTFETATHEKNGLVNLVEIKVLEVSEFREYLRW